MKKPPISRTWGQKVLMSRPAIMGQIMMSPGRRGTLSARAVVALLPSVAICASSVFSCCAFFQ